MKEIWIGTAHVIPYEGSKVLENALGAYVNAIALADDKEEYKKLVFAELNSLELKIIELKNIQLYEQRKLNSEPSDLIIELAEHLSLDSPVGLDKFHCYINLD